ncbi:MAG: hypothetical protein IT208_18870 [Chthonomonadales bacterium]|nr:hypothetical protein [Chthonomonadales bacterium]
MKGLRWVVAALSFVALVAWLDAAGALDCGGYCATQGSCPATGYGCVPPVCCYCCFRCTQPGIPTDDVCGYDPQGVPVHYRLLDQTSIYKCYRYQNCSYFSTQFEHLGPTEACIWCPLWA